MSLGRKIVFVLCLIVFVGSAGMLLNYFLTGMREQSSLEDLAKLKTEREDMKTDKGTVIGKYVDLYEANSDIIGWITVDGTKIDYPVMQTQDDPEFYLRRNFQKEHATAGVPFMDASSDIFVPTSNFLIYGHNMKNGTMFHDMLKYKDKSFYQEHKTFRFDTIYKGGQGTYEIIAAGYSKIYPEDSEGIVYHAEIGATLMSLLRGIQIGDPLDTVLAAFPDEGTGAVETREEGVTGRLLYGQYGYMEVYGAVLYDGETPISVRFADQDAVVEFHLADGAVTGVTYLLQTI